MLFGEREREGGGEREKERDKEGGRERGIDRDRYIKTKTSAPIEAWM